MIYDGVIRRVVEGIGRGGRVVLWKKAATRSHDLCKAKSTYVWEK